MLPLDRTFFGRRTHPAQRREGRKVAPVSQRIKWWNVVPGDQIKIIGDKTNQLYQVSQVNKLQNKVFVKNPVRGYILLLFSFQVYSTGVIGG
jgi:hypothetical protein